MSLVPEYGGRTFALHESVGLDAFKLGSLHISLIVQPKCHRHSD
jgi:hypothetical protein